MTFKQKVEEILGCNSYNNKQVNCLVCGKDCKVDRILAAYKEAVEGMPHADYKGDDPVTKQWEACKEHMLKEGR